MNSPDSVLESKNVLGGKVKLTLSKIAGSQSLAEVEAFIIEQGAEANDPFGALYESAPLAEAASQACQFPKLVVKPLRLLFSQFFVSKNAYTGRTFFNHGTRRFTEIRTNKGEWTGTAADLRLNKDQIESMNISLLMFNQERLGINNPKLRIRLRFFSAHQAQQALKDPTQSALLWKGGKVRPDSDFNVVIIRKKLKKGFSYHPFLLVVPATLRTSMEIFLGKPITISTSADAVVDEPNEAINAPAEESPAYRKVASPIRSLHESWAKGQSANLFLKRYWPMGLMGAASISAKGLAQGTRGSHSIRRSVWIAEPIGYWANLLESA